MQRLKIILIASINLKTLLLKSLFNMNKDFFCKNFINRFGTVIEYLYTRTQKHLKK